jgi:hypothetical protein
VRVLDAARPPADPLMPAWAWALVTSLAGTHGLTGWLISRMMRRITRLEQSQSVTEKPE